MRLADFILRDLKRILADWEAFAATRLPAAGSMTRLALRNDAEPILRTIALDLSTPQTGAQQLAKSHGNAPRRDGEPDTAAQTHGTVRAQSGFDINQMASEYRALRASVLRLWFEACTPEPPHVDDIVRFNEAIDQALADSIAFYTSRVEQSRNLFLGMLGHDLRPPLQAMVMGSSYLSRLNAGAAVSETAARLLRSAQRMQVLVNDLSDFNRVSLGLGLPVQRQPAELGQLLDDEVRLLQSAHPDRRILLEVRGSTLGAWDRNGLQRMLGNLVGNALKYGAQEAPVRVLVDGHSDDAVAVEVQNEGPEISPQMLQSIFEPLKRGLNQPEESADGDGGLGLGLHISREVARAHGGDLRARSSDGRTVFSARLPREANT